MKLHRTVEVRTNRSINRSIDHWWHKQDPRIKPRHEKLSEAEQSKNTFPGYRLKIRGKRESDKTKTVEAEIKTSRKCRSRKGRSGNRQRLVNGTERLEGLFLPLRLDRRTYEWKNRRRHCDSSEKFESSRRSRNLKDEKKAIQSCHFYFCSIESSETFVYRIFCHWKHGNYLSIEDYWCFYWGFDYWFDEVVLNYFVRNPFRHKSCVWKGYQYFLGSSVTFLNKTFPSAISLRS